VTDGAGGLDLDRDADLRAPERILEGDPNVRLEVVPAHRPTARAPASAAEHAAEEIPEIREVELLEVHAAHVLAAAGKAASPRRAEGVVGTPLLGVREDVVCGLDLLEPILGAVVAGVAVRVVLAGELPVGLLDVVVGGVLRDSEDLVGVRAHSATITLAGRTTLSPTR
jgi:hypothetical protein